jgi:hypothetical protein
LDERQNNFDSLLAQNQDNVRQTEPFAFESQVETDTHPLDLTSKSIDNSLQTQSESENDLSNETVPSLAIPNEREQPEIRRRNSNWTSVQDQISIKKETVTPVRQIFILDLTISL